jgi:quercetin dioxygenase-like cupin family protein
MEPKPIPYQANTLNGSGYEFLNKDDVLGPHYHSKNEGHITIVQAGQVNIKSVHLDNNWEIVAKAGDVCDLPDEEWHVITALEDNTKILNISKG